MGKIVTNAYLNLKILCRRISKPINILVLVMVGLVMIFCTACISSSPRPSISASPSSHSPNLTVSPILSPSPSASLTPSTYVPFIPPASSHPPIKPLPEGDPPTIHRQKTIDAMRSLPLDHPLPNDFYIDYFANNSPKVIDFPRTGNMFDVNEYFMVLDNLKMEPGYTLDYFLVGELMGALPKIYARKLSEENYHSWKEYPEANISGNYHGRLDTRTPTQEKIDPYLSHIQTDGSEDSYFQLIALYLMASEFYLNWHDVYHDEIIVCNQEGLDKFFKWRNPAPEDKQHAERYAKALQIDFTPRVERESDRVIVRIVFFTKWGGFFEKIYTLNREIPLRFLDIKTTKLLEYGASPV
jgi:hypothetical protein